MAALGPGELERFAVAAHLLGEDEKTFRLLDRAHSAYLDQNAPAKSCPRGVLALSSVAGGAHYRLAELHRLRTALIDLEKNTEAFETPYIAAHTAHAAGRVRLAEDDPQAALPLLRRAWRLWQQVEAPYEAARTRVQVSAACRALGDEDASRMELDGARTVFEQLGAQADLVALAPTDGAAPGHPLTARECEVLALVAQGHTTAASRRSCS